MITMSKRILFVMKQMLKVMLLCICTPAFASSSIVLPETGGIGTTGFVVGGSVLIAAASALFLARKKSDE